MKRINGRGLALIFGLVAGCGDDSGMNRMAPGILATVHGEGGKPVSAYFSSKTELLPDGTTVKVIADQEGEPIQARRKVVVSIQTGPSQGLAAQVDRSDLQPSK